VQQSAQAPLNRHPCCGLGQSKPRKSIEKLSVESGGKQEQEQEQEQEQLFALLAAASKSA